MADYRENSSTEAPGVLSAGTEKLFIFNVSGLKGGERRAIVDAILENYPPLVRHVKRLATDDSSSGADTPRRWVSNNDLERITAKGRWVVCGAIDEDPAPITSIDEIEEKGRDGWVCVQDTHPSAKGAGELRRLFGSRVFSVALLPAEGKSTPADLRVGQPDGDPLASETHAVRYMAENPSVITPEGDMKVFDLHLVSEDPKATVKKVLRLFENKFLEY